MTATEKQLLKLDILEAIQYYETRIENLKGKWFMNVREHFPGIAKQADHDIDIYERCIVRLKERHLNTMNKAFISAADEYIKEAK